MKIFHDPELQNRIDAIQKESQSFVEVIMKASNKPITYQDCQNIFFFAKIAELERKLAQKEG